MIIQSYIELLPNRIANSGQKSTYTHYSKRTIMHYYNYGVAYIL